MAINDMIAAGFNPTSMIASRRQGQMDKVSDQMNQLKLQQAQYQMSPEYLKRQQAIEQAALDKDLAQTSKYQADTENARMQAERARQEAIYGIAMFADTPEKFEYAKSRAIARNIPGAEELTADMWFGGYRDSLIEQFTPKSGITVQNNMGGNGIDYGDPPKDMSWARNQDGSVKLAPREDGSMAPVAVPIIGGPADLSEKEKQVKERLRQVNRQRAGTTVIQDLQRGLDIVKTNPTASGMTAIATQYLPESDGQALKGFVESALSNIGLDTLQAMREASPTGGALGQVPIQQQKRLEQVLGSLQVTQERSILEDNIKRVINIYKDIVFGTPEEIQILVEEGLVEPADAYQAAQRYELSFDTFGRKKVDRNNIGDVPPLPPGAKIIGQ